MKIVKTRPYQQKLRAHKQAILKLFSPQGLDGNLLYSLSMGGELIAWDLYEKRIKNQYILQFPHLKETKVVEKRICCAQFHNNILYTGLFDGKVYSWSIHTGQLIDKFHSHNQQVQAIKKISNAILITAGNDGVVNLWDTVSGNLTKSFIIQGRINHLYFKQSWLAIISNRRTISIINLQTNSLIQKFETKIGRYVMKLFEVDDMTLLQMSDNMLEGYNDLRKDPLWKIFIHGTWINSMASVSEYLLCGCQDSSLRMINLKSYQVVDVVQGGHYSSINSVELAFGKLFTGSSDTLLLQWSIQEFKSRLRERKMMAIEQLESMKYQTYLKFIPKKKKKGKKRIMSKSKSKSKKIKSAKSTK